MGLREKVDEIPAGPRKVLVFLLAFVGALLLMGPVFTALAIIWEYVSHTFMFFIGSTLMDSVAERCREAAEAVEKCDEMQENMTWGAYWERNPIGIKWSYFLGRLPSVAVGAAMIYGARVIHAPAASAGVKEIPKAQPPAPKEMTVKQSASLFILMLGVILLLMSGGFAASGVYTYIDKERFFEGPKRVNAPFSGHPVDRSAQAEEMKELSERMRGAGPDERAYLSRKMKELREDAREEALEAREAAQEARAETSTEKDVEPPGSIWREQVKQKYEIAGILAPIGFVLTALGITGFVVTRRYRI